MGINIRKMELGDLDQVLIIEREAFTTPWAEDAFVLEITKNQLARYLVAEIDGKIVGYGGIWLILDEGHITNVAVLSKNRGQGVGNYLVEGLIEICLQSNISAMTLEVRKSNITAQNLYKKYGFTESGIRPKYYSDNNEDAIIMWKLL